MIEYIYLPYRFLVCLLLSEIRIFRTMIGYCNYFLLNINLIKYINYLFNRDVNPFKSNEFLKFIKSNKKKWEGFKQNKTIDTTKETILIESFINTPIYPIENILIGKYLQFLNRSQCMGLLRKGDIKGEILFRSFGIDKFYYYKFGGLYQRCKYIYKSVLLLRNIN